MCGIAGFIGKTNNFPNKINIDEVKKSLFLRGPDANGLFKKEAGNKGILFVHTRLSIVDPNKNSNQPFEDEEGVIIFNGMIYNYLELKVMLKKKGVKFKTSSDTEVLLKMLNIFGEKAFKYLDGMWALAYYNFKNNNILISRDRFGEKPLYYYKSKEGFYFSNSIKAIVKLMNKKIQINDSNLLLYLNHPDKSIGDGNETFVKKIYKFPKSGYFKSNLINQKITKKIYWNIKISSNKISFNNACKNLRSMIKQTIMTRTRSDVKNCMLISGGLDSNTIAAYAKENSLLEGYTLKSPIKAYDESKLTKISAKINKFKLKFVNPLSNKSLKITDNIIKNSFNILPSTTALCFALLCEKIKKNKNKVILTGYGGDELFAGYYINFLAMLLSYNKKSKQFKEKHEFWKKNIMKYIRNPFLKDINNPVLKKQKYQLNYYSEQEGNSYLRKKTKLKQRKLSKDIFYNNMLQNLFYNSLPNQNHQADLVAMHYSIESRAPFLSHIIAEFVYKLKKDYFMHQGVPKSLLRATIGKKLPHEIKNNLEKTGFYAPFSKLFNFAEKKIIKEKLLKSNFLKKKIKLFKFKKLLNKKEKNITHNESKFLFGCLNVALIEEAINENNKLFKI